MKKFLLVFTLCVFTLSSYAQIDSTIVDSTLTQLSELPDTSKLSKDEVIVIVKEFSDWAIEQAEKSPDNKNPMDWIGWVIAGVLTLTVLVKKYFIKKKD